MNNIKKFEDFFDRMQGLLDNAEKQGHTIVRVEDLENAFPELKENEESIIRDIRVVLESSATRFFKENGQMPVWYDKSVAWLEKQGEQKPADKVEPKFHEGEWITNNIETVQITGYDIDYGYQVDYKGNLQHRDTDIIEKEYHLWTIQDAKACDVLVADNGSAFLYNGYLEEQQWPFAYGGINIYGRFDICSGLLPFTHKKVVPATKEQRDLLFQKMKEAGYEWDDEKKELKKIEEKTAWSEENETYLDHIITAVKLYYTDDKGKENPWREELLRWFKSLKDRYTWEPNDEQMDALKEACDEHWEPDGVAPLYTLYQDLKKLKG